MNERSFLSQVRTCIAVTVLILAPGVIGVSADSDAGGVAARPGKHGSVFYPPELTARVKANAAKYPWAAEIQRKVLAAAGPWMAMSDDQLWGLMFGSTLRRALFVNDTGKCPSCHVPIYYWKIDAFNTPWKVRCPKCSVLFPANDFKAFYESGLDEHGVFDPKRGDRSLLFNADHPDPKDPLHSFGVDDGAGWHDASGLLYEFIPNYLYQGQWQQLVWGGITKLAAAYTVSGDVDYARRAAILLDRVADLYPDFDFDTQGSGSTWGYVTYWCDASPETQLMALAYDQVFDAIKGDAALVAFLREKAARYRLPLPKQSFRDVQSNIEQRILRDALREANIPPNQKSKMFCNYPQQTLAALTISAILDWPENRGPYLARLEKMLQVATVCDGVSGEKGLPGYSRWGLQRLAMFLARWDEVDREMLPELMRRVPPLRNTYRFHSDTHFLDLYYPCEGDAGAFALQYPSYMGVDFVAQGTAGDRESSLPPSMYTFLLRLSELTGDPAYAQLVHHANGDKLEGIPGDIFSADPAAAQAQVAKVVADHGPAPQPGCVNMEEWHLACLRSGQGAAARGAWLDYDAGQPVDPNGSHGYIGHGHQDGMNLGLFAKGLDLMPDFGYPPLQYGGTYTSPQARWYKRTAAHNTVVVDGKDQPVGAGRSTLWAIGDMAKIVRASAPELNGGQQFERTVAMVDISPADSYLLDIFRVRGGQDQAKFMGSHFGTITTSGLRLAPGKDYGHDTLTRKFQTDPAATPGWSVDWKVEDRYSYLPKGADVHLRYTDLTSHAQASVCEAWVHATDSTGGVWIPRVMTRRMASESQTEPLASTFVAVIEPYERASNIASIRRLSLITADGAPAPDGDVAIEVTLADGRKDLAIAADVEQGGSRRPLQSPRDPAFLFRGDQCIARLAASGAVERVTLCNARGLTIGDLRIELRGPAPVVELAISREHVTLLRGSLADVATVTRAGHRLEVK